MMNLTLIVPKWPEGSLWSKVVFRFPYLALTHADLFGHLFHVHSVFLANVSTDIRRNQSDIFVGYRFC